jgi:hypothetical protein
MSLRVNFWYSNNCCSIAKLSSFVIREKARDKLDSVWFLQNIIALSRAYLRRAPLDKAERACHGQSFSFGFISDEVKWFCNIGPRSSRTIWTSPLRRRNTQKSNSGQSDEPG